ncbi:MAG: CPBP family intramembrane glutamic endopeptidase [Oscillospiraceae bacterium]|nr:CPBP family intramembrane glutamic endopeptidase [Oscillospiraceae bacterium]
MQKRRFSVVMSKAEIIGGFCFFLFYLLLLNPLLQLFLTKVLHQELTSLRLNLWFYSVCIFFTVLLFHRFLWGSLRALRQNRRRVLRSTAVCLLLYGALTILVTALVFWLLPNFTNQNNDAIISLLDQNPAFVCVLAIVLAPIIEECLFRGLIFGNLRRSSRLLAYVVTALGFSAIHVIGFLGASSPLEIALSALQYVPATLVLCGLYEYADNIWSPILLHASINLITCLLWSVGF